MDLLKVLPKNRKLLSIDSPNGGFPSEKIKQHNNLLSCNQTRLAWKYPRPKQEGCVRWKKKELYLWDSEASHVTDSQRVLLVLAMNSWANHNKS